MPQDCLLIASPNFMGNICMLDSETLFHMWQGTLGCSRDHATLSNPLVVLSKCADTIHNGPRLENRSWRLLNQSILLRISWTKQDRSPAVSLPKEILENNKFDVPSLSQSVETLRDRDQKAIERGNGLHIPSVQCNTIIVKGKQSPSCLPPKLQGLPTPSSRGDQPATHRANSSLAEGLDPEQTCKTTVVHGFRPAARPQDLGLPGEDHATRTTRIPKQDENTLEGSSKQSAKYMDESAIVDEEDSEWESNLDDPVTFKRVLSKANLNSQRSLISEMFASQYKRAKGLCNHVSQSSQKVSQRASTYQNMAQMASSANGPNGALEIKGDMRSSPPKAFNEVPHSVAQPIVSSVQVALSPGTTRRHILITELSESLRQNLLWERQHKSSTAHIVLERRYTSLDLANLGQYPDRTFTPEDVKDGNDLNWNPYLQRAAEDEYHARGW
ncbi:hypothetical protein BX600DRAFT_150083 [Xylariales sp. PMI_506]|nr:hypothetical protein BX600DRAFT_150083 [Xylariales sp. PMI_506]